MNSFLDFVKARRTIYGISKACPVDDSVLEQIVGDSVLHVPSAFNSQSNRVVLLLNSESDKLWDIVLEQLKSKTSPDKFPATKEKIEGFKSGYGTVLFFTHTPTTKNLQQQMPSYAENFELWAHHSTGMLQFAVWTALESHGLGASLQHYNPLIDEDVQKAYNLSEDWKLIAQMPFGVPTVPAGDKEFLPLEERFLVKK